MGPVIPSMYVPRRCEWCHCTRSRRAVSHHALAKYKKKKKLSQTHISPVLQLACDRELVGVGPSGRDWALRHAGGPVRPIRAILDNAVEMNRRRLVEEVRDVHQDEIACIELHLSAC